MILQAGTDMTDSCMYNTMLAGLQARRHVQELRLQVRDLLQELEVLRRRGRSTQPLTTSSRWVPAAAMFVIAAALSAAVWTGNHCLSAR